MSKHLTTPVNLIKTIGVSPQSEHFVGMGDATISLCLLFSTALIRLV